MFKLFARALTLSFFILCAGLYNSFAQCPSPTTVTITPADKVTTLNSITFVAHGSGSGGHYSWAVNGGSYSGTISGNSTSTLTLAGYPRGNTYAVVTYTDACGNKAVATASYVYISPVTATDVASFTTPNTCNAPLTIPTLALGGPTGRNTGVFYKVDGGVYTSTPVHPTSPGCHTIYGERATLAQFGNIAARSSDPTATVSTQAIIFPVAPVITAPANTCNSAFTLPSVPVISQFTAQYSIDGAAFSASPTIPTTPGCHSIKAQYALTAACGSTAAGTASTCATSNIVSVTIFPAVPTLVAPANTCNSAFALPVVASQTSNGFTTQYSVDNGAFTTTPSVPTAIGCHTVQVQYTLTSACSGTAANTPGICGPSNIVSVVIYPAPPSITAPATVCNGTFLLPSVTPVSGFTAQYSVDGGSTYSAAPAPTTPGCYNVTARYALGNACGSNPVGTGSPCASMSVNGLIFPAAPVITAPAAVCAGSTFVLPGVTTVGGFTTQYSVDGGTSFSASPTVPSTAGSYSVLARYVLTSACGTNTANSTAPAGCLQSNTVTAFVKTSVGILTQPKASTNLCLGAAYNLSVTASGTAPFTYQWNKNGSPIAGETASTFSIASVFATDAATYTVTINGCGSITSAGAVLNINTNVGISGQPNPSKEICQGGYFGAAVVASGTGPFTYQWKKGGVAIAGATSALYSIASALTTDAGNYTVTVSGSCGSPVTSSNAALTINTVGGITTQPVAETTLCPASTFNLSVVASGTGPFTYQWNKGGSPVAGETASTFSIANVLATDVNTYTVDVTGACGATVTSNGAMLHVLSNAIVLTQPSATTALCPADTYNLSVVADGQPPLVYQWNKAGTPISGATASTFSITHVSSADPADYSVTVTGGCGASTSNNATLVVNTPFSIATEPVALTTLCSGTALSLSVTTSGTGPFTYQWSKGSTAIVGATSATYAVGSVSAVDAGTYSVLVQGACGSPIISSDAVVNVNTNVSITTQPTATTTVCPGTAFNISVSPSGSGPYTYQWNMNGITISGATSSSFSIPAVTSMDAATYTVTVTGTCGTPITSNGAVLNVNTADGISIQPTPSTTLCPGATLNLSVTASGTGPFTYQWNKNGTGISGASSSIFTITNVLASDAATYSVTVQGVCGAPTTSSDANLVVNTNAGIMTQPTATTALCPGSEYDLSVTAGGSGTYTYQWNMNSTAISGATAATYSIARVSNGDAGVYTVTVQGDCGLPVTSANAVLAVNTVASISIQPAVATTLCPAGSFNLSVSASGTGPFSYQWNKAGTPMSGATEATFSIASVSAVDSATYSVTVSGACGMPVTSNDAVLTVLNPFPSSVITANTSTINFGGVVDFSYANTKPGVTYHWDFGDGDFPSVDQNPEHPYYSQGSYTVVLTLTSTSLNFSNTSKGSIVCTKTITYASPIVVANGVSVITGVTKTNVDEQVEGLSAYPVPAKDNLNIKSGSAFSSASIVDMQGRSMVTTEYAGLLETTLDVSNVPAGVYILLVKGTAGVQHLKIVKE